MAQNYLQMSDAREIQYMLDQLYQIGYETGYLEIKQMYRNKNFVKVELFRGEQRFRPQNEPEREHVMLSSMDQVLDYLKSNVKPHTTVKCQQIKLENMYSFKIKDDIQELV